MGYASKEEIETEFPASITLRFRSAGARSTFMSQLSDGWGENECELFWPWRDGVAFHETTAFGVENIGGEEDEPSS